jgi:CHASE2 domain-containing sensor protein
MLRREQNENKPLPVGVLQAARYNVKMKVVALCLTIAGTFAGGLSLVLLLAGWIGLVPYALIAAGALLLGGSCIGALAQSSSPRR